MKPSDIKVGRTRDGNIGLEVGLQDFGVWKPSVSQIREAVLDGMITGFSEFGGLPAEAALYLPREQEIVNISDLVYEAVKAGRMIDFGMLPNEVIKSTAERAGPLYYEGAFGMPFVEPWVIVHAWEAGVAVYLVQLIDKDDPVGGRFEGVELQPITIAHKTNSLIMSDRAVLQPIDGVLPANMKYSANSAPSPMYFLPGAMEAMAKGESSPFAAAAQNVLDPILTALLILNTRSVERETIKPPEKINRIRAKHGKRLIPPHDVVHSKAYVTAILNRSQRREHQGGTHASPEFHLRQGHWRNYPTGARTFIHDTLVNATEETRQQFKMGRSHYSVRGVA